MEGKIVQKKWSFKQLEKICDNKGIGYPKVYCITLVAKMEQANYHANRAKSVVKKYFNNIKPKSKIEFLELYKTLFIHEAEIHALVQVLNSMKDILAQIIDKTILKTAGRKKVYLNHAFLKKVNKTKAKDTVGKSLKNLLKDERFKYIKAFCNTIKHSTIIELQFLFDRVKFVKINEIKKHFDGEEGTRFKPFKYREGKKEVVYKATWTKTIIDDYKPRIFDLIVEAGNSINEYLKYNDLPNS